MTDVLIIGGGIVGLSTALAAAERGMTSVVIDSPRPGAASRAAAGMLAPSVEGLPPEVRPLAVAARDYYPEFLLALKERVSIAVTLDRSGIIELASSPEHREQMFSSAAAGVDCLDERGLARVETGLAGHAGGLLYPHDGAVDNVTLMDALDTAVAREPRVRRINDTVRSLWLNSGDAAVTLRSGQRLTGQRLLLASGAWASQMAGLPRALPVRPINGELLQLDAAPISHVIYGAGGYLIPRGRSVVIGATSDDTGLESPTTEIGMKALRAVSDGLWAALRDARVIQHWSGLRPMTPDTLPILGRDPDCPALIYACGFSRNGILLAPWAAVQLAPVLAGEPAPSELDFFSIDRFSDQ